MLSYQHGYHAGTFADVVKHFTLTRLLNYIIIKDKPLLYLETHSGRGIYDLYSKQGLKTGEWQQGIELLWKHRKNLLPVFDPYLQILHQINAPAELRYYPGSPLIAVEMLREQDRIYCCELHPREFDCLETLPRRGKRVFFNHSDGIASLKALLPPPEKRGLIFIDPSYEIKNEYKQIPAAIKTVYQRFSTGMYCLWYPIIDNKLHDQVIRGMQSIGADNALRIEFYLTAATQSGMTGCGLWIINPPFLLANEMKSGLQQIRTIFNPGISSFLVESC